MNVKKMTTEYLQEQVVLYTKFPPQDKAELQWFNACRKDLMRRWGIKG